MGDKVGVSVERTQDRCCVSYKKDTPSPELPLFYVFVNASLSWSLLGCNHLSSPNNHPTHVPEWAAVLQTRPTEGSTDCPLVSLLDRRLHADLSTVDDTGPPPPSTRTLLFSACCCLGYENNCFNLFFMADFEPTWKTFSDLLRQHLTLMQPGKILSDNIIVSDSS